MVRLAGLEPTTSAFAGLRSIHLSYKRMNGLIGAEGGIRTHTLERAARDPAAWVLLLIRFIPYVPPAHVLLLDKALVLLLRVAQDLLVDIFVILPQGGVQLPDA